MKAEFRATTPADAGAIAAFLGRVFEARGGEPIIDPGMMQWKYWKERPGWQGSRSFVLERGGSIVAHGAAWPAKILSAEEIPCFFLIDWAASSDFPGAGVSIMKHMAKRVPVNFVYGGTEVARKMRFAMGYRPRNDVHTLALPLHPLRQIVTSHWNWKTPARLARNLLWSRRKPVPPSRWRAHQVDPLEISGSNVPWPVRNSHRLMLERNPELFEYLSDCPVAPGAFFLAARDAEPVGYFCLTFPPGQARIADAWISSSQIEDWIQLYALAVEQAYGRRGVNEVTAAAVSDMALAALEKCGFRIRGRDPVQLYDPQKHVPPDLPLDVQLIDGDAAFRNSAGPDYLT
jgi:GNAT superfamily N-acetyltransferase